jgi:adenine-specific DNA-methyltransferase
MAFRSIAAFFPSQPPDFYNPMSSLQFKGKAFVQNHHLVVPFHELTPLKTKGTSAKPSLHDNLIVEGDNLLALKALLPTYHGKVKCIYIDPPYNTGNENWVYNDNVSSPMLQDWLGKTVDREDLTRHDKWCCMMLPRLKLLREFLTDDGSIFISIDDNEVHRLRCLMDEVFGEENFIANIIWQKNFSPKNTARHFSEDHDHLIVYARNAEIWSPNLLERSEEAIARYKNPDKDTRGNWASSDLTARNFYSLGTYEVMSPSGKKFEPSMGNYWRVSPDKFKELDREGRIWWGPDGNAMPRLKRYFSDVKEGVVPQTLWFHEEVGHTQDAKKELVSILQFEKSADVFNTVKPTSLIERILRIAADKNSIIMDSFAGSGTTAQAVLALNKDDGGNRRFILIECEDYADTITAERVRRVIKGVAGTKDEVLRAGLGGTFSYFKLGKSLHLKSILAGSALPEFETLAGYVFFTATGEEFDAKKIDAKTGFIGESRLYDVFLLYTPDVEKLKQLALTLDVARALPSVSGKPKLVFAPTKYLDQWFLDQLKLTFCQLPYEIYKAIDV